MKHAAVVNYHVRKAELQAFRVDPDGNAGQLLAPTLNPTQVEVTDRRGAGAPLTFEADAIEFRVQPSKETHFDSNNLWMPAYERELAELLKDSTGAIEVTLFDHTLRSDDPNATRRAARNVHSDYTATSADERLESILRKTAAADYRNGHYGLVNVWRPVEQPVLTAPLGFIHPRSITVDDQVPIAVEYPDRTGEVLGLIANPDHDWFYLSEMTPEEVAIFSVFDNRGHGFVGHSALDLLNPSGSSIPRKSIESRALVRYS